MERISLANVLKGVDKSIYALANLDPSDHRTRCFKRAAASYVSEKTCDPEIVNLGQLRGNTQIDWTTPYCEIPLSLQHSVENAIEHGVRHCRTNTLALVTVVNRYADQIMHVYSESESDEYLRQVVNGLAEKLPG